jgi:catechol 2,3-dioxygenase
MVFLAAGDYHHHIALNSLGTTGATAPPPGHTGLFHVALVYPDRRELAAALERLLAHGVAVEHASDHGGTVSLYLADPDSNGIELYYDRPRAAWFDADGRPVLRADRFDPRELLQPAVG